MGFDLAFIVKLKADIWSVLECLRDGNPGTEERIKFFDNIIGEDYDKFFKNMKIILGDFLQLKISSWNKDILGDDNSDLIPYVIHYLLEAGENGHNYTDIFEEEGDICIHKDEIVVNIFYGSSYKGREGLKINFKEILDNINIYQGICPSFIQKVKIGMS